MANIGLIYYSIIQLFNYSIIYYLLYPKYSYNINILFKKLIIFKKYINLYINKYICNILHSI